MLSYLQSLDTGVELGKRSLTRAKESLYGERILRDSESVLMPFIEEAVEAGAAGLEIQFGYNCTNANMDLLNGPARELKVHQDQSGYKRVCEYMKDPVASRLIMHHFQSKGFCISFMVSIHSLWVRFELWEAAGSSYPLPDKVKRVDRIPNRYRH